MTHFIMGNKNMVQKKTFRHIHPDENTIKETVWKLDLAPFKLTHNIHAIAFSPLSDEITKYYLIPHQRCERNYCFVHRRTHR